MDNFYAIQFYNKKGKCFIDEIILSKEEAIKKWESLLPDFIEEMEKGNSPEMAIWCDMESVSDYHTKLRYIHADDCIIKNGRLFVTQEVT